MGCLSSEGCCYSFFHALWLMIWPFISIVLGLIGGAIFGVFMTVVFFIYTLVRTPIHIAKMMYVTATTYECFERGCQYFDPILRIAVLFLVPFVHILWLGGVTIFSATCGTLYYISKATKMFYTHKYKKTFAKIESNVKLDKKSFFGQYVEACQEFTTDDEASYPAIYALKGICACIPGLPLGILPLVPFTLGVVLITLYRLPVNLYKTMKIGLFTVVLKWDLKLAALLMLPFAHVIFVLVVFVTAVIGSLFYFTFATTQSIANGRNPCEEWDKVRKGWKSYYRAHQDFVGKDFGDRYDHPTGILSGWDGTTYGIPIQKILHWQWDFLVCCFLLLIGFPICLVGSTLIFGVKFIPGTISWCRMLCEHISKKSTAQILGCWTFYLLAFVLMPVGALMACILAIAVGTFMSLGIPLAYLEGGYRAGFYEAFHLLHMIDGWDFFDLGDGLVCLRCLRDRGGVNNDSRGRRGHHDVANNRNNQNTYQERKQFSDDYWDRFANQCIRSASGLLAKKWISKSSIQDMDPSVMQTIPAVAVLEILVDTILDAEAQEDDILWTVDGTLCKGKDRPQLENIAAFLLPKVMQTKRLLSKTTKKKKVLCEAQNVKILTARLCNNTDAATDSLKEFVTSKKIDDDTSQPHCAANRQIRAKLIELSLSILQVKPFQDRMGAIFDEFEYLENGIDSIADDIGNTGDEKTEPAVPVAATDDTEIDV